MHQANSSVASALLRGQKCHAKGKHPRAGTALPKGSSEKPVAEPSEHHQKEKLCESSAVIVTAPFMAMVMSQGTWVGRGHIRACPLWHHVDSSWITDSGEEGKVWSVDEPYVHGGEGTRLNFHPENSIRGWGTPQGQVWGDL